jgi:tRNA(Ile)-lysidine synthase
VPSFLSKFKLETEVVMQTGIIARVREALTAQLDPTKKYLVACSGGSDSMALTDAMQLAGFSFVVGHVEHGLRGAESLRDAAFVRDFCAARQLKFGFRQVQVREYCQQQKVSLEDGARILRWQALQELATDCGVAFVVTAHQKNDQAETFLLRLLRGSGTRGLGGIRPLRDNILHPLLTFTADELKAYCRERKLQWCEDSSNQDVNLTRNRIRHQLLPLLEREYNPKIVETLARTAVILQQDAAYLAEAGKQAAQRCLKCTADGQVVCDVLVWRTLPEALQQRVLQEQWSQLEPQQELSSVHLQALSRLCRQGASGKKLILPGSRCCLYAYGKLTLYRQEPLKNCGMPSLVLKWDELVQGKSVSVPGGTLQFKVVPAQPFSPGKDRFVYPWEQLQALGPALTLRTRLPGDVFYPYKGAGHKKLQDYFTDCKIPAAARDQILLAAVGEHILWVSGRQGAGWRTDTTNKVENWLQAEVRKGE